MYDIKNDISPRHFLPRLSLSNNEVGYTLIEIMIVVLIIGIVSAIAITSYQTQVRRTQLTAIYQEINLFPLPYQIMIDGGEGVTGFSPSGLNIPTQTDYCQFSVTAPAVNGVTTDAVKCTIQNLAYIQGQSLSLDRTADGSWECRASVGISTAYLPNGCR
jgi:type IV pilus assembly protein PilA